MTFESPLQPEEESKEMPLHIPDNMTDESVGLTSKPFKQSELYDIPTLPIGEEDIVSLDHRDPTGMSIEERGKYVDKIIVAYHAIKDGGSIADDRTYIMARWLQEALLVPQRTGKDQITSREIDLVLVSQEHTIGDAVEVIHAGLHDRAGVAMVNGNSVEQIKLGML